MATQLDNITRLYTKITHLEPTEALAYFDVELRSYADQLEESDALNLLETTGKPAFMTDVEWDLIGIYTTLPEDHISYRSGRSILGDIMTEELRGFDGEFTRMVDYSHSMFFGASDLSEHQYLALDELSSHTLMSNRMISSIIAKAVKEELAKITTGSFGETRKTGEWVINVSEHGLMTVFCDGLWKADLAPITLTDLIYAEASRDHVLGAMRGLREHLDSDWILEQVCSAIEDGVLPTHATSGINGYPCTYASVRQEMIEEGTDNPIHREINERLIIEASFSLSVAGRRMGDTARTFGEYTVSHVNHLGDSVQVRVNGVLTPVMTYKALIETFITHKLFLYMEGSDAIGDVVEEITACEDWKTVAMHLSAAIMYHAVYEPSLNRQEFEELNFFVTDGE